MAKRLFLIIAFLTAGLLAPLSSALAQNDTPPQTPGAATFQAVCDRDGVECANSPNECGSNAEGKTPINCVFLEEPVGGDPGYDLYKVGCNNNAAAGAAAGAAANAAANSAGGNAANNSSSSGDTEPQSPSVVCHYTLWFGEAIIQGAGQRGPLQAILSFEPGKEYQGPFGLLYSYTQVVYNYLSGLIIAFVIFVIIAGGVMITTSGASGDQNRATKGKEMILHALIGMAIWFLASVILYTINPTFFSF